MNLQQDLEQANSKIEDEEKTRDGELENYENLTAMVICFLLSLLLLF